MVIATRCFGPVEVDEHQLLHFPRGLVGLPSCRRFLLLPHGPDSPFTFLQSVDDPALAWTLIDPRAVEPGYVARVRGEELAVVGLDRPERAADAVVLATVTIPPDVRRATVNLLAPLVIDPDGRQGVQVVLEGAPYAVRHPLFPHVRRPTRSGSCLSLAGAAGA